MKNRLFLFLKLFLILLLLGGTRYALEQDSSLTKRELVAPPSDIIYFTAGHREIIADMLWIRSIQDFDYCENKIHKNLCKENSWLYQMLDVITDLSPNFRMAYSAGAMALTIIISDIEGASKFFDKAVKQFPTDWLILFKAAYHAIYEEKNNAKGAELIERAGKNGAPDWVYALATRLYTAAGKKDLAEGLIRQLEASGEDPAYIQRIRERMSTEEAGKVVLPEIKPEGN